MQNIATDMRLQTAETRAISRKNSVISDAQFADPFMMIIMNMLSQYADEMPQTDANALQTLGGEQNGMQGVLEGLSAQQENASAQLLQLMGTLPTLQFSQPENASELSSLMGAKLFELENGVLEQISSNSYLQLFESTMKSIMESGKKPDADAILQMLTMQSTTLNEADPSKLLATTQNAQTIAELIASKLNGKEESSTNVQQLIDELKRAVDDGTVTIKAAEADSGEVSETRNTFATAVEKAKELLAKQPQKTGQELSADALDMQESKPVTPFELRFKAAEKPVEVPVADQISNGIKENLALGKNEFTVKLNPESLGEITIKLVEDAGKTTLTITTASAQTAKLINSDMDSLKAAVAPMNVQVNEAVTHSEASQQGGMQQFDMSGQFAFQQQTGQQFAAQQSFLRMTRSFNNEGGEELNTQAIPAMAALSVVSTGRLDAYV